MILKYYNTRRNRRKKYFVVILALATALCFVGCKKNSDNTPNNETTVTDTDSEVASDMKQEDSDTNSADALNSIDQSEIADASGSNETTKKEKVLEEVRPLKDIYKDYFYLGVALNPNTITETYSDTVIENFNSITCENEMKPDYILNKTNSMAGVLEDPTFVAIDFSKSAEEIRFCEENNIKMRFHTLVWHAQTPEWFFHEAYDTSKPLVDAETMKKRMKNYISKVITYLDTEHPDLVYTIDVVNEAFNGEGTYGIKETDNRWYDTIGYDYLYYAFVYTKEAINASQNMKDVTLVYNDYSMIYKVDKVGKGLDSIFSEHGANPHDYIDVIGFQGHYDIDTSMVTVARAVESFAKMGYEIQVTELDIGIPKIPVGEEPTEEQLAKQAKKYRSIMERLMALVDKGYNISSVSVWGISDDNSWRKNDKGFDGHCLLWDAGMIEKPALRGMGLCSDIISYYIYDLER